MRRITFSVLIIILLIPEAVFCSSVKIAGIGGTGMIFPEQGISLNLNPASVQFMDVNIFSLNSGSSGRERYYFQIDMPGGINEKSRFNLSFQLNDQMKKSGLTAGMNILPAVNFGISINYFILGDMFRGLGYNVGFSMKSPKSYIGFSLVNASDTVLSKFREKEDSNYEIILSTPLSENNFWGFLDPAQRYIILDSTSAVILPEEMLFSFSYKFEPNFFVGVDLRQKTNNFKKLKFNSDNTIYFFEQNFSDKSAVRASFAKEFWSLGVGFERWGFETNYAYIQTRDKGKKHMFSFTLRNL
ncbi:MAG TPA: hypothetical protein ENN73_00010 [Firmicutes bacterium]|nr:hypothetical protein [Bacillota bacterium]